MLDMNRAVQRQSECIEAVTAFRLPGTAEIDCVGRPWFGTQHLPVSPHTLQAIDLNCHEAGFDRATFFLAAVHAWLANLVHDVDTCVYFQRADLGQPERIWRITRTRPDVRKPFVDLILQVELAETLARSTTADMPFLPGSIGLAYLASCADRAEEFAYPWSATQSLNDGPVFVIEVNDADTTATVRLWACEGLLTASASNGLGSSFLAFLEHAGHRIDEVVRTLVPQRIFAEVTGVDALITSTLPSRGDFLIDEIEAIALARPDATAIRLRGDLTSYAHINARADAIAFALLQNRCRPGDIVAMLLPRDADLIACLLAVAKIGAAACPLDIEDPPDRLAHLLEQVGAAVLVVAPGSLLPAGAKERARALELACCLPQPSDRSVLTRSRQSAGPDHVAHIVFTSGSTGAAKAVLLSQRALHRLAHIKVSAHPLDTTSRVAQTASVCFDAFIEQVLMTLAAGAELIIIDHAELSPENFRKIVDEEGVSDFVLVPSMIELLDPGILTSKGVRIISVGEPCPASLISRWRGVSRMANAYGPAEATVCSHMWEASDASDGSPIAPVGRPLPGVTAYVLDEAFEPVALGQTGEIYIGGFGVALGYLGDAARTAEMFLPDPFIGIPGARMYRTGDIGQVDWNGQWKCLGRADYRTNIRGVRGEPAEIEAVLRRHAGVRRAAVVGERKISGTSSLVAYIDADPAWQAEDFEAGLLASWKEIGIGRDSGLHDSSTIYAAAGWTSTFSSKPIDASEMDQWWIATLDAVRSLRPCRMLDVGCGSAQLLEQFGPDLDRYDGIDPDAGQLARARHRLNAPPLTATVSFRCSDAASVTQTDLSRYDTVVLNSTIQYFPSHHYLRRVVGTLLGGLPDGSSIFIGDIRDFRLLSDFLANVRLERVSPHETIAEFRSETALAYLQVEELCVEPRAFTEMASCSGRPVVIEWRLKRGHADNELIRYRYDIFIHIGPRPHEFICVAAQDWLPFRDMASLDQALASTRQVVAIRGLPNARLASDAILAKALSEARPDEPVLTVAARTRGLQEKPFVHPEEVVALAARHGFQVTVAPPLAGSRYSFDAVFVPTEDSRRPVWSPAAESSLSQLTNMPTASRQALALVNELRHHASSALPARLLPAHYIVMPFWPTTHNQKLDRHALPPVPRGIHPPAVRTATPLEELVAGIMARVLRCECGPDDDFFAAGGHSLLAVRLCSRIEEVLGSKLPVRAVFEAPTPRSLARHLISLRGPVDPAELRYLPPPRRYSPPTISSSQRRLWFLEKLRPGGTPNVSLALRIRGRISTSALTRSIEVILGRHETMRSRFVENVGDVSLVIDPAAAFQFDQIGVDHLPDPVAAARDAVRHHARRAFDVKAGGLLRGLIIHLGPDDTVAAFSMHHLIADGWSIDILLNELAICWRAFTADEEPILPELPCQYSDHAAWEEHRLKDGRERSLLEFWLNHLRGSRAPALPFDRPVLPDRSHETDLIVRPLAPGLRDAVRELCVLRSVTPFMVLLATLAVLLRKLTNQTDLIVGSPVANRGHPAVENLIGFFANTVAYRILTEDCRTFSELLNRVRGIVLDVHDHQDMPFDRVIEEIKPERNLGHHPLFDVWFAHMAIQPYESRIDGAIVTPFEVATGIGPFALSLSILESTDRQMCIWEYATDLFDQETVESFAVRFETLLDTACRNPETQLHAISILTETEQKLLQAWSRGPHPLRSTIEEVIAGIEDVARTDPDRPAVTDQAGTLTYAALWTNCETLAGVLSQQAVRPSTPCAILVGRTRHLVTSYLAVLRLGAMLVPLDPELPLARLRQIVNLAAVTVGIVDQGHRDLARSIGIGQTVIMEECPANGERLTLPTESACPYAYLLFTSGSSGRPKGVLVGRQSLATVIAALKNRLDFNSSDVMLATTSVGFDISLLEILLPMSAGAMCVVREPSLYRDGSAVTEMLARYRVTVIQATPSALRTLVATGWNGAPGLTILAGGEALTEALAATLRARCRRLLNLYGPTETTIWSTVAELSAGELVTIGRPLEEACCYILDRDLAPVPVGTTGELYIGGGGVAYGYYNDPALTAASFLPDLFGGGGGRMYRTGDLAAWTPQGQIRFIGRADRQLKLLGHRIEPGEIEAHLTRHPAVSESTVLPVERSDGTVHLVGFFVAVPGADTSPSELEQWFTEQVPSAFRLTRLFKLESMPTTRNGKLDMSELKRIAELAPCADATDITRDEIETRLAALWSHVLGRYPAKNDVDFFVDLGGHSLAAARLTAAIGEDFGIDFPLRQVFLRSRFAEQTAFIRACAGPAFSPPNKWIDAGPPTTSSIQRRLWAEHYLLRDPAALNVVAAVLIRERIQPDRFRSSLANMIAEETLLRSSFCLRNGVLLPSVQEDVDPPMVVTDLGALSELDQDPQVRRAAENFAREPFDPKSAPLVRIQLLLGEAETVLVLAAHHLIADARTLELILEGLADRYWSLHGLPRSVIRYESFARWETHRLGDAPSNARREPASPRLQSLEPVDLSTDYPRLPSRSGRGCRIRRRLPAVVYRAVTTFAAAHQVTPFSLVLSAFGLVLHRHAANETFAIAVPVSLRDFPGSDRVLGPLLNTAVIPMNGMAECTASGWVKTVFQRLLDRLVSKELLAEQALTNSDARFKANVLMAWNDLPTIGASLGKLGRPFPIDTQTTQFDLALSGTLNSRGLELCLDFDVDLFVEQRMHRIMRHIVRALFEIIRTPSAPAVLIDCLEPAERERLTEAEMGGAESKDYEVSVTTMVDRHAQHRGMATAISAGDVTMTYSELKTASDRVARYLRSAAGPGRVIGLCGEPSPAAIVTILGILKSGCVYLPVNPRWPAERIREILSQAGTHLMIAAESVARSVTGLGPAVLPLETLGGALTHKRDHKGSKNKTNSSHMDSGAPAVIFFTSGSTGSPKGVVLTLRNLSAVVEGTVYLPNIRPGDRMPLIAPLAFDISLFEMLHPLVQGATLEIVPDVTDLADVLACLQRAAAFHAVSSLMALICAEITRRRLGPNTFLRLRKIFVGGENVPRVLLDQIRSTFPHADTHILYGPTEASIVCTSFEVPANLIGDDLIIGHPLPHARVRLVDRYGRPTPVGVKGEIHVSGACVAKGYAGGGGRSGFYQADGQSCYATGDFGVRRADGAIRFVGRTDGQVKIRGMRVELAEVERVLERHPVVKHAVAVARQTEKGVQLAAFYICNDAPTGGPEVLRDFLRLHLPDYMVPGILHELRVFPQLPNGKLDRAGLEAWLEVHTAPVAGEPPTNETEVALAEIWQPILRLETIGRFDSVLDLGADSLKMIEASECIADRFGQRVKIVDLYMRPTLAAQADLLNGIQGSKPGVEQRALLRDATYRPVFHDGTSGDACGNDVLLTGATGFLGAHLLAEILQRRRGRVLCLVRADDEASALERITNTLDTYGLAAPNTLGRITPLPADLSHPDLGLASATWSRLAEVSELYHAGAVVDFLKPYGILKSVNVEATRRLLDHVCRHPGMVFHHISTLGVLRTSTESAVVLSEQALSGEPPPDLYGGYARTKWVAERLVWSARDFGADVRVYRVGHLSGNSRTGLWQERDFLRLLLKAIVCLGAAPETDDEIDLTPVDLAARLVLDLAARPAPAVPVFHLVNPRLLSMQSLLKMLESFGYRIERVRRSDWVSRVIRRAHDDPAFPLRPFVDLLTETTPTAVSSTSRVLYEFTNTVSSLGRAPQAMPDPVVLVPLYLRCMIDRNFLPRPD